ncbi:MAG: hypothetical protein ACW963_10020, partial [Candidatus Sifarchaeia archaeon]
MIITEALMVLCKNPELPIVEDDRQMHSLNRELYFCFREAYRRKKPQLLHQLPTCDAKNPPNESDNIPTASERTRPDFYWDIMDHQAEEEFCERRFVLECKRLGKPSSKSWNLNENYVQNGIRRFITQPHEYGKGDDTCGMVGYIQNMTFDEILREVNLAIIQNPEPISLLSPPNEG